MATSDAMSETKDVVLGETVVSEKPHGSSDLGDPHEREEPERAKSGDEAQDTNRAEKEDESKDDDIDAIPESKDSAASTDVVGSKTEDQSPTRTDNLAQDSKGTCDPSQAANSKDQIRLVGIRLVIVEIWHFSQIPPCCSTG